jgi:hypothetical protein
MMFREWLYTAITRASDRCILLYTHTALKAALGKQKIKGSTLLQKIEAFNALQRDNGIGKAVDVTLPEPERLVEEDESEDTSGVGKSVAVVDDYANFGGEIEAEFEDIDSQGKAVNPEIAVERVRETPVEEPPPKMSGLATLMKIQGHVKVTVIHEHVHVMEREIAKPEAKPKSGLGSMTAISDAMRELKPLMNEPTGRLALPAPLVPRPPTYEWSKRPDHDRTYAEPFVGDPEIIARHERRLAQEAERVAARTKALADARAAEQARTENAEKPEKPKSQGGSFGALFTKKG